MMAKSEMAETCGLYLMKNCKYNCVKTAMSMHKHICISLALYIPRTQYYFHTLQPPFLYGILNYFLADGCIQFIKFEIFTAERVIMVRLSGL